ncbi:hypothetical protein C0585_04475 [Candidatus Woesearchaeota archaeon]|nr:MAG: hypothetical protein C0585_04475 [Candidatus Woesearchaeota archaeon]
MPKKIDYRDKLLYELSLDCRIKNKDLAKILKISPQLTSYTTEKLIDDKVINFYELELDPAKFGLINIILFGSFSIFEKSKQNEIIRKLKELDWCTYVETAELGTDLILEFTVPNLSFFNKVLMGILEENQKALYIKDIYPVIVKHNFNKRYLYKKSRIFLEKIFSGDRQVIEITKNDKRVLNALVKDPKASIVKISNLADIDMRTVLKIIKNLKKNKIIRGFGVCINNSNIHIDSKMILIDFKYSSIKETNRLISYCNQVPEIESLIKLIGKNTIMIRINSPETNDVFNELRKEFQFQEYEIYSSKQILKNIYIPMQVLNDDYSIY